MAVGITPVRNVVGWIVFPRKQIIGIKFLSLEGEVR